VIVSAKAPLLDLVDEFGKARQIAGDVRRDIEEQAEALEYADELRRVIAARIQVIDMQTSGHGLIRVAVNGVDR
jgi:hypothetical protein